MIRGGPAGNLSVCSSGDCGMQSAQPRDIGALALVVGLFVVLFIVTLMYGGPAR